MNYLEIMADVLEVEAQALSEASKKLNNQTVFALAELFKNITTAGGSLVFCGVGKSGLVCQKLAATFTSLGLPSFFLHPTEALHGDLGTLRETDGIVFLSYSGTTEELLKLFPYINVPRERRVALVGNTTSPVAENVSIVLDCSVEKEACVNNQAPTTSSTLAMAMGDAMAVLYENLVSISPEDFATFHPGGKLGKSLRLKVGDLMIDAKMCAVLDQNSSVKKTLLEMTRYPLGAAALCGPDNLFNGLIVESDIRRLLSREDFDLQMNIAKFVNKNPVTINPDCLASEALSLMENRKKPISVLPVIKDKQFLGILRLHDLFKEGL